jgi:hypothetical protein
MLFGCSADRGGASAEELVHSNYVRSGSELGEEPARFDKVAVPVGT